MVALGLFRGVVLSNGRGNDIFRGKAVVVVAEDHPRQPEAGVIAAGGYQSISVVVGKDVGSVGPVTNGQDGISHNDALSVELPCESFPQSRGHEGGRRGAAPVVPGGREEHPRFPQLQ